MAYANFYGATSDYQDTKLQTGKHGVVDVWVRTGNLSLCLNLAESVRLHADLAKVLADATVLDVEQAPDDAHATTEA